jgi:hypothetical protein
MTYEERIGRVLKAIEGWPIYLGTDSERDRAILRAEGITDDQPTDDIVLPDDDLDSDELGDPDVDTDRVEDGDDR